jgi:hypothetical protein
MLVTTAVVWRRVAVGAAMGRLGVVWWTLGVRALVGIRRGTVRGGVWNHIVLRIGSW